MRSWAVLEVNGLIFAWHHAHGEPPAWTLPAIPEFDDPAWVEPIYTDRVIASCLQEVGENDVDFAHFQFVHGLARAPPRGRHLHRRRPHQDHDRTIRGWAATV